MARYRPYNGPIVVKPAEHYPPGWIIDVPGTRFYLWFCRYDDPKECGCREGFDAQWAKNGKGGLFTMARGTLEEAFQSFDGYPNQAIAAQVKDAFRGAVQEAAEAGELGPQEEEEVGIRACSCCGEGCALCNGDGVLYP